MTNREIANELQISPAALSLILNNKPGVSDRTRARVIRELEEMGYLHLLKKVQQSRPAADNICFVVYKRHGKILNQHPFFLLLMEGIEACARECGYHILMTTIDKQQKLDLQIENLQTMDAKGYIFFGTEMLTDDIKMFRNLPFPFVVLDNDFSCFDINTVAINNKMGTYQAVEYLYQTGHRKIGYLKSSVYIDSFGERALGYIEALHQFGLILEDDFIFEVGYTEEGSYHDFIKLLEDGRDLPEAFITDDDTIACGVMRALSDRNIRVPEDISIIGFNDRPGCELSSPKLTSINVPRYSFGKEAVNRLVKLIQKEESGKSENRSLKVRIGTQLVKRDSVRGK